MREGVEGVEHLPVAARREIAVAIVETDEAFVEPRKLAGEIVDLLALEAVGIGGEIEGPAGEMRDRLRGIAGRPFGSGKSGAASYCITSPTILSPSS